MTYAETDLVATFTRLIEEAGWVDPLLPEQLQGLDQLHVGGMAAVDGLIDALDVGDGDAVLDVGSGLGGPTRRIASRTGAAAHGVDITESYVETAQMLTARCQLDHLVSFECIDAASVSNSTKYDAAMTMHVQMNVADKQSFFADTNRALKPGGRLAMWDVCLADSNGSDLAWPMPWSIDGSDSHLATADQLHDDIVEAGFDPVEWSDETAWAQEWFAARSASGHPKGPSLPMWMDDGFTRILNLVGALTEGQLAVVRGVFTA